MLKQMIALAAFAILMVAGFPVAAQEPGWSLYLINGVTNEVVRISLDGTQESFDLGLPPNTYLDRRAIDFTNSGERVAYCQIVNQPEGARATLHIRDVNSSSPLATVEFGATDGCWVRYNDDGSRITASVVRYPSDETTAPEQPLWQLLVLDVETGAQIAEMNASKMGALSSELPRGIFMPDVRYFANGQIIFAGLLWGTEGFPMSPAYLWQVGDDSVQAIDRWWRWGLDSLAGMGELVWLELDDSIAYAQPFGPVPLNNTVKLADGEGNERVIYANTDWVLLDQAFINNGRQLAVQLLEGGADPMSGQQVRWVALDRAGNVSDLYAGIGYSEVAAAPDGYVILWASDSGMSPTLTLEYHSGREAAQLWQTQSDDGIAWSILWAAPTPTAEGLEPFPTISP